MATPIQIRPLWASDVETVADFNVAMAHETESISLDPPTVRKGVKAILDDSAKGSYFVAEVAGEVVGCLLITHEWSDWRNGDLWWIQSVYVAPTHRGRGVFRSLYNHVRDAAKAAGARGLRLYVERENATAQATYHALGMEMTHYRMMEEMFAREA